MLSKNIEKDLWTKLVWNSAFNPISVLYNATISELYASSEIRKEILGVMKETVLIAEAKNIGINAQTAENHFNYTGEPDWASFKTSMLQDYQAGKEIELDDLLGFIVAEGQQMNIPTPFASGIYEAIKAKLTEC